MKEINYTYHFRVEPEDEQIAFLNQQMGNVRFLYNYFLDLSKKDKTESNSKWNYYTYQNQIPELLKKFDWLKLSLSQSRQVAVQNLDRAYQRKDLGLGGFPKHKKKTDKNSFSIPQGFKIHEDFIQIPKLKSMLKIIMHRPMDYTKVNNLTITKSKKGNFYISINVKKNIKEYAERGLSCGIDKNIGHINYGNHSNVIEKGVPKVLEKYEKRLKHLQRLLSKKDLKNNPECFTSEGKRKKKKLEIISKNRNKVQKKIINIFDKVSNIKKDFLHQLSNSIVKSYDNIFVEDLNVSGMLKNHNLAKSISAMSWSELDRQLQYKSDWYGKTYIEVGRFFPSSKQCNVCGFINKKLKLSERKWTCEECKTVLHRDNNAVLNILDEGMRLKDIPKIEKKKKMLRKIRKTVPLEEGQYKKLLEKPTMDERFEEFQNLKSSVSMNEEKVLSVF